MIKQFVYIRPRGIHKTEVMLDKIIAEITTRLQNCPEHDMIKNLKVESKNLDPEEYGVVFSLNMDHDKFQSSTYFLFIPKDDFYCDMSFDIQLVSDKIDEGDILYLDTFIEKAEKGKKYEVNFESFKGQYSYVLMKKNHVYDAIYDGHGVELFDITKFTQLAETLGLDEFFYLPNRPFKLVEEFDDSVWTLCDDDVQKLGKHFGLEDIDFSDEEALDSYICQLNEHLEEYDVAIDGSDLSVIPTAPAEPIIDYDTKKTYTFETVSNNILVNDEYWLYTCADIFSVEDWIKVNKIF